MPFCRCLFVRLSIAISGSSIQYREQICFPKRSNSLIHTRYWTAITHWNKTQSTIFDTKTETLTFRGYKHGRCGPFCYYRLGDTSFLYVGNVLPFIFLMLWTCLIRCLMSQRCTQETQNKSMFCYCNSPLLSGSHRLVLLQHFDKVWLWTIVARTKLHVWFAILTTKSLVSTTSFIHWATRARQFFTKFSCNVTNCTPRVLLIMYW